MKFFRALPVRMVMDESFTNNAMQSVLLLLFATSLSTEYGRSHGLQSPPPHSHERQSKTTTSSENEASFLSCRSNMPDPLRNPPTYFQNLNSSSKLSPSSRGRALNFAKAWRFIRLAVQRRSTSLPDYNLGRERPQSYAWFSWKRCFRPALSRIATEHSRNQNDRPTEEVMEDSSPLTWSRLVDHTAGDVFRFMSPES